MNYAEESLKLHAQLKGKLEVVPKVKIENKEDLSLAYTPGVAEPCLVINKDYNRSFDLTGRGNLVAVITDGTAVLGLGDIGPEAGMPVMEGNHSRSWCKSMVLKPLNRNQTKGCRKPKAHCRDS